MRTVWRVYKLLNLVSLVTNITYIVVVVVINMVVQWFGVRLAIKRSLVRLPAGALSRHLGQFSLPSPSGVGKSSTSLYGWG